MVAGQAVVWYSGQFYALFFLTSVLRVDSFTGNLLVAWSLVLGTMGFVLFGWLSDKIGRKRIILGGCIIAALTYFPVFRFIAETANPALATAQETVPVVVVADPAEHQRAERPHQEAGGECQKCEDVACILREHAEELGADDDSQ